METSEDSLIRSLGSSESQSPATVVMLHVKFRDYCNSVVRQTGKFLVELKTDCHHLECESGHLQGRSATTSWWRTGRRWRSQAAAYSSRCPLCLTPPSVPTAPTWSTSSPLTGYTTGRPVLLTTPASSHPSCWLPAMCHGMRQSSLRILLCSPRDPALLIQLQGQQRYELPPISSSIWKWVWRRSQGSFVICHDSPSGR